MVMMMTVRLNNIWLHIAFSHILGPDLNQQLKKFILFVMLIMRPYSPWNLRNYLRLAHKSSSKFLSSAKRELEIFLLPEPETRSEGLWESLKLPVNGQNHSLASNKFVWQALYQSLQATKKTFENC